MKTFLLIDIDTSTKPLLNINPQLKTLSARRAALLFMSYAFAGKKEEISATIRVQNELGNIKSFKVRRSPVVCANKSTKFKHYIV